MSDSYNTDFPILHDDSEQPPTLHEKYRLFKNQATKRQIRSRDIFALLLVIGIGAGSFLFANRITKQTPQPQNASAAPIQSVRFMNVYYKPRDSDYYNNDSYLLDLKNAVKMTLGYASAYHHDLNKQVVQFDEVGPTYIRDGARPNLNGETDEIRKQKVLTSILNDTQNNAESICSVVNRLHLDEVWLWFDSSVDIAPGEEFVILTKNGYGARYPEDTCPGGNQSFVVLAFDYNTPLHNAVHSFGHYLETLLNFMQGDDMFFGRFTGASYYDKDTKLSIKKPPYDITQNCGDIHTPPNVPMSDTTLGLYPGYDYTNSTVITNNRCWNWTPDGSGAAQTVTANTWMTLPMPQYPDTLVVKPGEYFYVWWMQNMPHSSNQVYFNGKKIPQWWDFVSNTDYQISKYMNGEYWMSSYVTAPVAFSPTTHCSSVSGTSSTCSYTPKTSSTLGVSTENNSVLAATTYADMSLVTVAYKPANMSTAVSSVTYCGDQMTRVGASASSGGGMKSEMWYKTSPKTGTCPVVVTFSSDPRERIISTTLFNNIDQVTPISETTKGGYSGPYSPYSTTISATLTGRKDSLMLCTYSIYSEQSGSYPNSVTANAGTTQLWKFEDGYFSNGYTVNVWAGLLGGVQRVNDNQSTTLSWNAKKTQPSTYTCANFNVKPFGLVSATPIPSTSPSIQPTSTPVTTPVSTPTPTPVPTPTRTPTPTPIPTVTATPAGNITYLQVPQNQISTVATSQHVGYEASRAIDGNISTFWHSEWTPVAPLPQWIWLSLPNTYKIGKITYLPRQDGSTSGVYTTYTILASADGVNNFVVASGTWLGNNSLKTVTFTPTNMKYIAVIANAGVGGYASAAEINLWYQSPVAESNYSQIAPTQIAVTGTSQHVGYEAAKVSDNNTSTFWNSEWNPYAALPQSVSLSLGGSFPISKIVYTPRQDGSLAGNITNYRVLVSNNGVSYSVVTSGQWPDDSTPKTAAFFPTFANYVQLEALNGNSGYASASEVSVWLSPINLTYSSPVTVTSQHVGYEAYRATDTNFNTFWHSEWSPYSPLPQSIILNLGKQYNVKGIVYIPRQDGGLTGTVTAYKIFSSNDGVNYSLVYTGTWLNNAVYKSVMFPPVNASYVKMQVDSGDSGYASAALFSVMY